jgi:hypothetical protein
MDDTTNLSVLEALFRDKNDPLFKIGMCFRIDVYSIEHELGVTCPELKKQQEFSHHN